jgi:hypothetical protein
MSLRPSDPPRIQQGDMLPGDVIMSKGNISNSSTTALLEKILIAVDQGDYTHASLWTGSHVIEALEQGVSEDPLSLTMDNQVLVDIYRFEKDGHHLGDAGWPVTPIIEAVYSFIGRPYGYADLMLAGTILLAAETIPKSDTGEILLRLLGDHFAQNLLEWLDSGAMVCTQVVVQAYWQAPGGVAKNQFALEIPIDGKRRLPQDLISIDGKDAAPVELGTTVQDALHELRAEFVRKYADNHPEFRDAQVPKPGSKGLVVPGGSPLLPAGFVSPYDMQRSPNLKLVGTLKEPS